MRKAGLEGVSLHSLRLLLREHRHSAGGVPMSGRVERLEHADQNITLSIYSHALPADKRAATKAWSNAMADVIAEARQPRPERMLANVCTRKPGIAEVFERKRKKLAGTTGLEPATSDVTGRRSNQLSYVPALCQVSDQNNTGAPSQIRSLRSTGMNRRRFAL